MPYATIDELLERYDARDLGDLVADDDTQVTSPALRSNPRLLAAINDASGEIDAALLVGNRYSPSDLVNIQGHSRAHLIRITCDIAAARIMGRRIGRDIEKIKTILEMADAHLERLRKGENVFNLADQKDAANPRATTLSAVDYSTSGLIRDRTKHYYPARPVIPTFS